MGHDLKWLEARSVIVVISKEAVWIAKSAKSPTDAFKLAENHPELKSRAEAVRYLAMIKRDYGEVALDNFVSRKDMECKAHGFQEKIGILLIYFKQLEITAIRGLDEEKKNLAKKDRMFADFYLKLIERELWYIELLQTAVKEFRKEFLPFENDPEDLERRCRLDQLDDVCRRIFSDFQKHGKNLTGILNPDHLNCILSGIVQMGNYVNRKTGVIFFCPQMLVISVHGNLVQV